MGYAHLIMYESNLLHAPAAGQELYLCRFEAIIFRQLELPSSKYLRNFPKIAKGVTVAFGERRSVSCL